MAQLSISVAMCTFNGERFLEAQLQSIASQSRPPDELIICDDGSSDDSNKIVLQFARQASFPVHFTANDHNLQSTKNFEQAIGLCRGSVVALADQDDIWYPHKLERLEGCFLQSPTVVAAFSDADLVDDNLLPLGRHLWPTFAFSSAEQKEFADDNALRVLIRHPVVTGATMAFRREAFELMRPFPKNEIHDQWMSFLLAAYGRFEIVPEPLMQYRRHHRQQVGPGPLNWRQQIAKANSRREKFYFDEVHRFRELERKLARHASDFPRGARAQNEIRNKLLHLEHRARLPERRIKRISNIFRETMNLNYSRYSGGWISIAKDLIMR
jgi:glycosyltransferase involved in cell wall biosynthesis